jgi:hypothetical protein
MTNWSTHSKSWINKNIDNGDATSLRCQRLDCVVQNASFEGGCLTGRCFYCVVVMERLISLRRDLVLNAEMLFDLDDALHDVVDLFCESGAVACRLFQRFEPLSDVADFEA